MTQRATKKYVSFGWSRGARRVGSLVVASVLALAVSACSSSDYAGSSTPVAARPASTPVAAAPAYVPPVARAAGTTAYGAPITGSDGYPNINVDTARPIGGNVRSVADQDRLEAELLALGARQRVSGEGSSPSSVMRDLQDLGRRARSDAERQIESGAVPPGH